MTTKDSSPARIHAQAVEVASRMKRFTPNGNPTLKIGVAMEDKIITIEMPWDVLHDLTEEDLAVGICALMRGVPGPFAVYGSNAPPGSKSVH